MTIAYSNLWHFSRHCAKGTPRVPGPTGSHVSTPLTTTHAYRGGVGAGGRGGGGGGGGASPPSIVTQRNPPSQLVPVQQLSCPPFSKSPPVPGLNPTAAFIPAQVGELHIQSSHVWFTRVVQSESIPDIML